MLVWHVWSRVRSEQTGQGERGAQERSAGAAGQSAWLLYTLAGTVLIGWLCVFNAGFALTRVSPFVAFAGALAAIAGCVLNRPARRLGWLGLAGALALLGAGDLIWAIAGPATSAGERIPFGVDAAYLVGYVALISSLLQLSSRRAAGHDLATAIDVGIVALGLSLLAWLVLVERVVDMPGGRSSSGLFVPAAYGVTALLLAVVLVRMLFQAGRPTVSARLLESAIVAFLVSDILYVRAVIGGTWATGSPADAGWLAGYLLWGAAALHPSSAAPMDAAEPSSFSFGRAASLATACLVVPAALMWSWAFGDLRDLPVIAAVSALVSLLWMARVKVSIGRLHRSLDERKLLEGRLREQAMRDPLVGLLNRTSFEQHLAELASFHLAVAVLYLDLDDFKVINDTLGHAAGDAVLVQAARRVSGVLRNDDLAARLGGDEFAVLLRGADQSAAEAVAVRILGAFRSPFAIDGRPVHLHGSIGVSVGGPDKDPADLMREADVAMYLAKGQGKGRYQVFETSMHAAVMGRIALRAELEQAIANREFVLHYQPIVTFCRRTMFANEALVRWRHPDRGLLLPAEFIDLAEETGLIVQLGQWVIEEALREAVVWGGIAGDRAPAVTINVSPVQFHHPAFVQNVVGAMVRSGIDPSRVILELTESTLIDSEDATTILPELRRMGIRIALDDFGTGYSSLAYLAHLPIDVLKIDRAFVAALGTGARDDRLAAAIVNLSHDLRIQVIAEGVETEAQLDRLIELGCGWIQGWLVAGAMPSHDIERLIAEWPARAPVGSGVAASPGLPGPAGQPAGGGAGGSEAAA